MSDSPERPSDAGRIQLQNSDTGMQNINQAGPSEARIAELRSKVEKLRGMSAAIAEGEALINGPTKPPDSSPPPRARVPAPFTASPLGTLETIGERAAPDAASAEDETLIGIGGKIAPNAVVAVDWLRPTSTDAPPMEPPAPTEPAMTSSSIGGTWVKPTAIDTYKPSGSGSWGVFERPVDISRAMGGGKLIGVGATQTESAEEEAAKDAQTAALLAGYLAINAVEDTFERERASEIEAALAEAKNAMRLGEVRRGVRVLEPLWAQVSHKSEVGGKVGLELAMAYDAAQEAPLALALYEELLGSRSWQIRKLAKQLKFGHEAMEFFGIGSSASEVAYVPMFELEVDRRYSSGFGGPALMRAPVTTVDEALETLRVAASSIALQRWTEDRVKQALSVLALPENWRRVEPSSPLNGVWQLVLHVTRRGDVRADERLRQTISPAASADELRLSRLEAFGPLMVSELEGVMRSVGPGEFELRFSSYRLGPWRVEQTVSATSTVLVLEPSLLVTMEREAGSSSARYFVWTG